MYTLLVTYIELDVRGVASEIPLEGVVKTLIPLYNLNAVGYNGSKCLLT